MQYMLLIYDQEAEWERMSAAQREKILGEYRAFTTSLRESGKFVGGDGLKPTSTATTVRVRDGKTMKTHGPFAETREQLGGFYVVEVKDLDEACALAARIPSATFGSIEVRPVIYGTAGG